MKRIFTAFICAALCAAFGWCVAFANADTTESASSAQQIEEAENEPVPGVVDEYGSIGPVIIDDVYSFGIHHATLTIKGYKPIEVEIYSNSAPQTSSLFCNLLMRHYYDNKRITGLMTDMYAQMGDRSGKTAGKYTVEGEFKEAGFSGNDIELRRGTIAMSRASQIDGDATSGLRSDASTLYVFLSDTSYLSKKYAGFAKISKGIATFDSVCKDIAENATIKDDGRIAKKKQCPVIESFVLDD